MAEIKSTLELALERAKGIEMSSEKLDKIQRDEIRDRATRLVARFMEDDSWETRKLAKFIEGYSGQEREVALDSLKALLLERFEPNRWKRARAGLLAVEPEAEGEALSTLSKSLEGFELEVERALEEQLSEIQETAISHLRSNLMEAGIRGSAIQLQVGDTAMRQTAREMAQKTLEPAIVAARHGLAEHLQVKREEKA